MGKINLKQKVINLVNTKNIQELLIDNLVKDLYLVGSAAKGEENDESDIDLVFVPENEEEMSLSHLSRIYCILSEKLNRKIDFIQMDRIKPGLKESILKDKVLLFSQESFKTGDSFEGALINKNL